MAEPQAAAAAPAQRVAQAAPVYLDEEPDADGYRRVRKLQKLDMTWYTAEELSITLQRRKVSAKAASWKLVSIHSGWVIDEAEMQMYLVTWIQCNDCDAKHGSNKVVAMNPANFASAHFRDHLVAPVCKQTALITR
jgi:hypothetical protein